MSWLDFKLGLRMQYPGLTLVGGLAMSFGIALGAAYLEVVNDFRRPRLPLEDGNRIVGLRTWDLAANDAERASRSLSTPIYSVPLPLPWPTLLRLSLYP